MKYIYLDTLEKKLIQKINSCYIFLGENLLLSNHSQDLILHFSRKKGFTERIEINIEKNTDWEKVTIFYSKKNLFFTKTILIINFFIKIINSVLIKNINKTSFFSDPDIIVILKLNQLSRFFQENTLLDRLKSYSDIVYCFTPYNIYFTKWIKYEIQKKNINIENNALILLCTYYEGDTLFIYKILEIILITWPNTLITREKIKKIITNFSSFSSFHWINAIFNSEKKRALYILYIFYKKKYNTLTLIRCLQKDLLILIGMKREKNLNISMFLKNNNVWNSRFKFFKNAFKKIHSDNCFKAIQILLQIEIKIKKQHNHSIWMQLKELTLILD